MMSLMTDPQHNNQAGPANGPDTATIIVNYRSAQLTIDALHTVAPEVERYRQTLKGQLRVIVTDNNSGDDSIAQLEAARETNHWHDWLTILPLPKNGGFAYGNNEGIRYTQQHHPDTSFYHLLNPDTLLRDNAIVHLVQFLQQHPDAGLAGSRLEDPDTTVQVSAFRFPTVLSEFESSIKLGPVSRILSQWRVAPHPPTQDSPTDWVAGASLIARREVLDNAGLLDESYFMYYEEVDWIRHAKHAGYPCWYAPQSRVVHLVGQVSGVTSKTEHGTRSKRKPRYVHEARRLYWLKNHGRLKKTLADLAVITGTCLHRIACTLRGQTTSDPQHYLSDFIAFNLRGQYPDRPATP